MNGHDRKQRVLAHKYVEIDSKGEKGKNTSQDGEFLEKNTIPANSDVFYI